MDHHVSSPWVRPTDGKSEGRDWCVAESWTKFIFPFLFDPTGVHDGRGELAEFLIHDPKRPGSWTESDFGPRELDNMLPYVRQYLKLPKNHRRIALNRECLGQASGFRFTTSATSEDYDQLGFDISEVVLNIFFNGVACLSLEIRPRTPEHVSVKDIELINARLASLANGAAFELDTPWAGDTPEFSVAAICQSQQTMTIKKLIDTLLEPVLRPSAPWSVTPMVDRFLPIYGAILLSPSQEAPIDELDERFYQFAQHHLTILRKTFTPNNISTFSEIHLEDSAHHYVPYHNVIHSQSLDGGFILAYDNGLPHFSRSPSPAMESFRTNYFFMMLIPYHQRLSILRYAMAAANAGLSPERGSELRRLREEIYDFTSRCYFSEASVSEERNHIYDRWQQEFHVVRMYNELKEEVHDIDNYLADLERERENELRDQTSKRDSRNMQLFAVITLVFLPVSLLLVAIPAIPILNRWINFATHPLRSGFIILAMVGVVILLLGLMFRYLKYARSMPKPLE